MAQVVRCLRDLVPRGRSTAYVGSVVVVFLVCLMIGVYLSDAGGESAGRKRASPLPSSPTKATPKKTPKDIQWVLVPEASTDFGGSRVDTKVWDLYDSVGHAGVGFRRPSAITVEDGSLRIKATGDVSGGLSQKFNQIYGRWEVRARMERGNGYGPAILLWPDSEKWPDDGEIDFFEAPKGDRKIGYLTVHWGSEGHNFEHSVDVPGDYTEWHVFSVDWLPDRLVFYVDGVEKFRVTEPERIPTKPMHLAMQNDIGKCNDKWFGCRDQSTPSSVSFFADSVRVYQFPRSG